MKIAVLGLIGYLACAVVFAADSRPNIMVLYVDDMGYLPGFTGGTLLETPNMDALASSGMVFTDGYVSSPICGPSRVGLMTGRYQARTGHDANSRKPGCELLLSETTMAQRMKALGYKTGIIGKWHLGIGEKGTPVDWNGEVKPGPLELGFDYSFLLPNTNDRVPCVYLRDHHVVNLDPADPLYVGGNPNVVKKPGSTVYPDARKNPEAMTYYKSTHGHNQSVINGIGRIGYMSGGKAALWDDETMTDVFVEEARKYIEANKERPFFLYFASQSPHVPRTPNPRFRGKSGLGYRGDAMVEFDWAVGEIMKTLEENGLSENTIVIFSSDNGPVYDDGYDDGTTVKKSSKEVDGGHDGSGIWRGGKYQIYEGGTRVPFIVKWPGRIEPGVSDALVNQIDFMASFASLLNQDLSENEAIDSRDALEALLGQDTQGHEFMIEEAGRQIALRQREWKYIIRLNDREGRAELYNLADDPGETKNIIRDHLEKADAMAQKLDAYVDGGRVRDK